MPAELKRTARRALYRSAPGHLQPRTADGRIIKYRQLISAIACLLPATVLAGPKNGQVVAGEAVISTPDANTTVIRQSTDKSVINWQSFSIGSQEYVKFVQPDRSSISLNRVIGGNPSSILGNLSANGQVYLVNPNGITTHSNRPAWHAARHSCQACRNRCNPIPFFRHPLTNSKLCPFCPCFPWYRGTCP